MSLTALAYLVFYLGGILMCIARHPRWGLYTYIMVFYLDAPGRWWGASLPGVRWSLLIALVTLLTTLARVKNQRTAFTSNRPIVLFICFVVLMLLQSAWVISSEHGDGITLFTKYIVVLYLIYTLVDTREGIENFLLCHVIGLFYLGVVAFTTNTGGGRLDGVGGPGMDDANTLGMQMATGVICAGALFLIMRGWRRWAVVLATPFMLNTIVLAGSRGAFLALVAGGAGVFLLRPPGHMRKFVLMSVLGIGLLGYLATDAFWSRIATINDVVQDTGEADVSAASRFEIIKAQWKIVLDYPMGVGHMGTAELSEIYIDAKYHSLDGGGRSSHNTFMSALVDQGFIGLLLWAAMAYSLVRICFKIRQKLRWNPDQRAGWLCASLFGMLCVIWSGGMFAPFLKAEVYIWTVALVCCLSSVVYQVHGLPSAATSNMKNRAGASARSGVEAAPPATARRRVYR